MRYIKIYPNSGAVQTALDAQELGKPYMAFVEDGQYIDWNSKSKTIIYSAMPLTIEALEDGFFKTSLELSYSVNDGEWITSVGTSIGLLTGDKVRFKGNLGDFPGNPFANNNICFNVYGNILSLSYGDDFADKTLGPAIQYAFANCKNLIDASNLILPAGLINYNYTGMFNGCISLTTAPELPATALTSGCYQEMFKGCTSLSYIKCLATSFGDIWSLRFWVDGVSPTGTFVKHPNAVWPTGVNGIPEGWTVEDADI